MLTAAIAASVVATSGSAQAPIAQGPGAPTLSFYEPNAQGTFKIQDIPPNSPTKRLGPKYRFSIGDKLTISIPLYDTKGGTRQGRLYVAGTIVKGGSFKTAAYFATGTYVLNDHSQISAQGYFTFSADSTAAVVGGTGHFEGARGHLVNTSNSDSSTDTLTLLP